MKDAGELQIATSNALKAGLLQIRGVKASAYERQAPCELATCPRPWRPLKVLRQMFVGLPHDNKGCCTCLWQVQLEPLALDSQSVLVWSRQQFSLPVLGMISLKDFLCSLRVEHITAEFLRS